MDTIDVKKDGTARLVVATNLKYARYEKHHGELPQVRALPVAEVRRLHELALSKNEEYCLNKMHHIRVTEIAPSEWHVLGSRQ